MLNCKIGDLAIVVNTELPQNLGQIVEVIGLPSKGPIPLPGPGHAWQVRAVSGRKSLYYKFKDSGRMVEHAEGPVPDCRLRPLSGLSLKDGALKDVTEPYDAIAAAMREHPGLTREKAERMAEAFGF